MESRETIPGFALVALRPSDRSAFFTQDKEDEAVVWRVWKPDADSQARQDPALLMFNGPTPIPPGKDGKGTQDTPAQVLHDGGYDSLPNGVPCGPIADSWYVWSNLGAFTCQSHDICRGAAGAANGIHTVWVAPGRSRLVPLTTLTGGDTTVAVDAAVSFTEETESPVTRAISGNRVYSAGYYLVSVSATLSSTEADEGDSLRLRVYYQTGSTVDGSGDLVSTYLTGYRKQEIDTDVTVSSPLTYDTFYTAENVSFTGVVYLPESLFAVDSGGYAKWVDLSVINKSASAISVGDAILSIVQVGGVFDNSGGSLQYPST